MSMIASFIRRHIFRLGDRQLFTSRDLLKFGPRSTIDQTMYRLVKQGKVIRLARGVFMKQRSDGWRPTIEEVAKTKAAAFFRKIYLHPRSEAIKLGIIKEKATATGSAGLSRREFKGEEYRDPEFWSNGANSSFKYGNVRIHFRSACQRKLKLQDDSPGKVIKSLLFLGRKKATEEHKRQALLSIISREERESLRQELSQMPQWLAAMFTWFRPPEPRRRRLKYEGLEIWD